jgi:NAD(P)H dehydrogenase (quinone)
MTKIAVVYESRTGNVERMARSVEEGIVSSGAEAVLINIADKEADLEAISAMDGMIAGSFTSYGQMSSGMSAFFEKSSAVHQRLKGKAAGAFASSGDFGGGNETTVMSLIQALMVHGMVIQGSSNAPHFGAVALGVPDGTALAVCFSLGERVAALAGKLASR